MKNGFKSTEFTLVVFCVLFAMIAATVLVWYSKITSDQWVQIAQWVPTSLGGIYTLGRTFLKSRDNGGVKSAPASASPQ